MKNDAMQRRAGRRKTFSIIFCVTVLVAWLPARGRAQVNSGSNGSDGALDFSAINYSTNIVIDMHDHPNGIYQYTYVNIPSGVTVSFIPNANNTPVYWLVQSNVVINGTVNVAGLSVNTAQCCITQGGAAGPGGWPGGNGGTSGGGGQGLGGGAAGLRSGCSASHANPVSCNGTEAAYGNDFLISLLGGSGGGGATDPSPGLGGGGGGGAILIATSTQIQLFGSISAVGGNGFAYNPSSYLVYSGNGSGGAVRLVASKLTGNGIINVSGGSQGQGDASSGFIRFDTYDNEFRGTILGVFTQGSQFIIIPTSGQLPQLTVTSVGGVPVSASPTGVLSTPDAVLSSQQNNPIPVVVSCANLPLNTQIAVSVKPANGAAVSATGYNTGTLASSTATFSINMPRGGGLIYATAATSN